MTSVILTNTKVKAKTAKRIVELAAIKGKPYRVEIANTALSTAIAEKFAELLARPNGVFRVLDLHNTQIKRKGVNDIFRALESNKTLESLSIGSNDIDKSSIQILQASLKQNKTLVTLSIKSSSLQTVRIDRYDKKMKKRG